MVVDLYYLDLAGNEAHGDFHVDHVVGVDHDYKQVEATTTQHYPLNTAFWVELHCYLVAPVYYQVTA